MNNFKLNNGQDIILPRILTGEYEAHWKPEGFTNEQHHATYEAISSSGLWNFNLEEGSPYKFFEMTRNTQNGKPRKETKSMKFGTIAHLIVLEPSEFKRRVVIEPKWANRSNSNAGKDERMLWRMDQHPDAIIFPSDENGSSEYEKFVGVVSAIANHKKARDIFEEGVTERSGFFKCPRTGILTRFRPDFTSTKIEGGLFVDFKTSKSGRYRDFQKTIDYHGYHVQMALYREGYKQIHGYYPKVFAWVVVENKFPFEVFIYPVNEAMLEHGVRWYNFYMDYLKLCLDKREFPQSQVEAETMVPSDYAMNREIPNYQLLSERFAS